MLKLARVVIANTSSKFITTDFFCLVNFVAICQRFEASRNFIRKVWMIAIRSELLQRAFIRSEMALVGYGFFADLPTIRRALV